MRNMSKSEAVVIESIEVRELLRFLFYLDILNKFWLLQRKHSKYMYARCLNFPCFITYLAACMHAFCMFYLYVSLGFPASDNGNFIGTRNISLPSYFHSYNGITGTYDISSICFTEAPVKRTL